MSISLKLSELDTPSLLIDKAKLFENIDYCQRRAHELGVNWRPHVKTHKCAPIAAMQVQGMFGGITVSTVKEAEYMFDEEGITDIIYAVGIAPQKLTRIALLNSRGADVKIILDNLASAMAVSEFCRTHNTKIGVLLEIDCDGHRSGLKPDDPALVTVAKALTDGAVFKGVLTHAGDSYLSRSREELEAIVNGFVSGEVADYQMAAWMMAVYLRGMTDEETAELTDVMAHSGVMVDLSPIPGIKVDKHSTGGVGDKTTLVIAPIVAACGVKIAKMSGRGLGHTGGTIDKMESVPGTKTALSQEEFFAQVNKIGLSVIGQSEGIAVADKKMYALRDVTATVSCIPLIASSIMSKKLASGSDAILLDVTTGTGAFMKTVEQSIELAKLMVSIGTHHGRRVAAMITDMDTPLGHNIGNSLEVMESMDVLKGHGPADLTEVCLQLATNMLVLADKGTPAECRAMAEAVIADGSAFAKCKEMFAAQGGDTRVLDDYSLFEQPAASFELLAEQDGYIVANDAEKIGSASVLLGAGRQKKGDPLDFAAGITLHKKRGDYVHKGESLATFYGAADRFDAAAAEYRSGLVYGPEKPEEAPLVYALVTKDGVERYE